MIEPVVLVVVGSIGAGSVAFVALPFLRRPTKQRRLEQGRSSGLALLERRDRALAALKELEFDHRTGKVSDDDYFALLGALRRDAAEALQRLKSVRPNPAEAISTAERPRRPRPASLAKER